jgi:hypothetical protein
MIRLHERKLTESLPIDSQGTESTDPDLQWFKNACLSLFTKVQAQGELRLLGQDEVRLNWYSGAGYISLGAKYSDHFNFSLVKYLDGKPLKCQLFCKYPIKNHFTNEGPSKTLLLPPRPNVTEGMVLGTTAQKAITDDLNIFWKTDLDGLKAVQKSQADFYRAGGRVD